MQQHGLIQRELGRLSDTRWACRYRNVSVIKERFTVIIDVLNEVQHLGDAEIRVQAQGLARDVQSCKFVASLYVFCRILSISKSVSDVLQSSTINISASVKVISAMITSILELREKPSLYEDIFNDVRKVCSSHEIKIEGLQNQESKRKTVVRESPDMLYSCSTIRKPNLREREIGAVKLARNTS